MLAMITEKRVLKEKLDDYYSEIFEKELIEEIIEVGGLRNISNGKLLIDVGDELTHIPLITRGAIKLIIEEENQDEIVLYYLEKGSTCAISFVNCIHRTKSIFRGIAVRDSEAIFIPVNKLDEWLVKYRTFRYFIIDSYHFRLIEAIKSVKNLAFKNLDERLIEYLMDKVKLMKTNILNITHQEIATDMHTSRTIISRLLKDLENEGKLKLKIKKIIINNM